jgi:hypothetical protein
VRGHPRPDVAPGHDCTSTVTDVLVTTAPSTRSPTTMQLATLTPPQPVNPTPTNPTAPLFPKPAPAPSPVPVAQPASQPQPQASVGALLLGKLGGAQQRAVESQQLIGAVSQMFTQRMSTIGHNVWALLRGTKPGPTPEA